MTPAPFRIRTLTLAMLMLLVLPHRAMAATFTDSSGQQVSFTKPFSRIISLYSAHSENVAALGAAELLIGIGGEDDFPPEILGKNIFSYREDAEKFLAAAPDLVLVRPMIERSYPELLSKLRRSGITVVSLQPNTVEEIFAYWHQLGLLVGRAEAAEAMIVDFSARKDRVREKVASIPEESRPKVYFEAIHAKMKTFATDSIAMYVLQQAGGNNVAADAPQVRQTNIADYGKERLLARGEEIDVFVAQRGRMNPVSEKDIRDEPGFGAIRAVRQGRIVLVPEALVSRPTPRLAEGIEQLHQALYPNAEARP
jgi:iron complex transport system substrate-binding protein